jgi:GTPase
MIDVERSHEGTCALILHDERTEALGKWVHSALTTKLGESFSSVETIITEETEFLGTAKAYVQRIDGAVAPRASCVLIVAIFWEGHGDSAKSIFMEFKQWVQNQKRFIVQALNAKAGQHTLSENESAFINSIKKKLPQMDAVVLSDSGNAARTELKEEELTPESLERRVVEGQGECCWVVTAESEAEFPAAVAALSAMADRNSCGMFPLTPEHREIQKAGKKWTAQEFLIRRCIPGSHIEMRLAMCGNVDSGKSTLTSVLTRGCKDDGRGFARAFVFVHKHEADTGRTSSISENHLGFDARGSVVNYKDGGAVDPQSLHRSAITPQQLVERSAKMVTLFDLAGHEKYLKTTVLGMTRSMPDYACIVISANNGIQRMTKEHLGLCLALKLPFFIVVTRIDATPENVRQETIANIFKLLKMPTVKKLPYPIRKVDDVVVSSKNLRMDRITPIFEVSNVTGAGIPELVHFINLLPLRKDWTQLMTQPREMIIDSTFFVTGVGTVVGGIVTQGVFRVGDNVHIGPDGLGGFRQVQIKSIHVKGVDVDHVNAGNDAAFCLKKEKRSNVRKGNVLLDLATPPTAYWQFEAEIVILYHSTTISANYEPVIHSTTVRQSARIMLVDQEVLRTGDRANVKFHFLYRPEFMKVGHRLIFREGRTKGIGTVTRLMEHMDEHFLGGTKQKTKEAVRLAHQKP